MQTSINSTTERDALVVYHAKCPDGFAAAFAAWLRLGDRAEYLAYDYGMAPPQAHGKHVYIIDFCFEPEQMQQLEATARKVVLLDHHESAVQALHGYRCRCAQELNDAAGQPRCKAGNLFRLDMDKSGARLAWEYFHPGAEVPDIIRYVEDRDLWRWRYGHETQHFLSKLDSLPRSFEVWKQVLEQDEVQREAFMAEGRAMTERFEALVASIAKEARPVELFGHQGLMVNTTREFASEVGSLLAKQCGTFALAWHQEASGTVKISLRGSPGFEVLNLAKKLGGGGHPYAAGARLPSNKVPELLQGRIQEPVMS